jgi:hypothetical protein
MGAIFKGKDLRSLSESIIRIIRSKEEGKIGDVKALSIFDYRRSIDSYKKVFMDL